MALGDGKSVWKWSRIGLPLLVLAAGLLCTALAVFQLKSQVERAEAERLETLVTERLDIINDRVDTYVALLRSAAGFMSASTSVTADEFAAYVERLRLRELYSGVQGIGYARAFRPEQRDAVAREMRERGVPNFTVRPDGPRDFYSSIVFLEPDDERNQAALGFDMFSEPVRRAAMERARDTGLRTASGKVVLAQEIDRDKQFGFLIYLPLYSTPLGRIPPTVEERRRALTGWVYSPFRAGDLFERAFAQRGRTGELRVSVYDGATPSEDALLYRSSTGGAQVEAGRTVRRALNVAEHRWTLVFERTDEFVPDSNRRLLPLIAGGGIVTTLLLFGAALGQTRATAMAEDTREQLREMNASLEQRVEERTAQLESARSALETLNRNLETIVDVRTSDLKLANEEIQRFAYIVSHDLRSPLVNVMGFTSELQVARETISKFYEEVMQKLPDAANRDVQNAIEVELPEAIDFIRSSTSKMDRLINAILRLSREGGRVLTPEPIRLKDMLEATGRTLAHQLQDAEATLEVENVPDLVSDRLAVEQIFTNLLENAVKYLAPGRPGRIRVRGWKEGSTVFIDVEDNGRGIDPKDHARVFDLFRRAGAQDRPGEGIGLAHVRALVRRLGGSITLNSSLGEGATFRVSLPDTIASAAKGEV